MSGQIFDVRERILLNQLPTLKVGHLRRQEPSIVGIGPAAADMLGRAVRMIQALG